MVTELQHTKEEGSQSKEDSCTNIPSGHRPAMRKQGATRISTRNAMIPPLGPCQ